MKIYKFLTAISALLLAGAPLSAQTLSPADVAAKILTASPQTHADALGVTSLAESLKTESNLPDPEIEGEYLFAPSGETNRWGAGISWGIEWPGVYSARKNDARGKVAAAEAAAEAARQERLIEIKRLLLDYVLIEKQLAVLKEVGNANDSIMLLSKKAEGHGEMTRLDINKLKLEQASLNSNMAGLLNDRAETITALDLLYGADCSPLLKEMVCEFPDVSLPMDKWEVLQSPSVVAANAEAEASRGALKIASAESYPGLSIGYQHAFEEGLHFNGASVGISIPVFSSRNKKTAAKAAIAEAEYKVEMAKADAESEVAGSVKKIAILSRQIDEMAPVVENPENATMLMKAYRGGIITLIDYLNERNYFTNATLELLTLRHSAATALLNLQRHYPRK